MRDVTAAAITWATLSKWQHGIFYMYHPTDRIIGITAFVTLVIWV